MKVSLQFVPKEERTDLVGQLESLSEELRAKFQTGTSEKFEPILIELIAPFFTDVLGDDHVIWDDGRRSKFLWDNRYPQYTEALRFLAEKYPSMCE